jgi:DNA adenine methylase
MTLLRRLGNKQAVAKKILPYFPPHDIYIEPFFGAGGMFFNKPRAKHNFLNDNDDEVFNLYMVVLEERERLKFELSRMPVHQSLWKHWKTNIPNDRVLKAVRFLFYSNFGVMGGDNAMRLEDRMPKNGVLQELQGIDMVNCTFWGDDFEPFLRAIRSDIMDSCFTYCDPPYLNTSHNYQEGDAWNKSELARLFDVLEWRGCKFAVSEFDNPTVIEMARYRGLQVHIIGERQNMKNRRVEILITNYEPSRQLGLF